jgi:hypothetical protein
MILGAGSLMYTMTAAKNMSMRCRSSLGAMPAAGSGLRGQECEALAAGPPPHLQDVEDGEAREQHRKHDVGGVQQAAPGLQAPPLQGARQQEGRRHRLHHHQHRQRQLRLQAGSTAYAGQAMPLNRFCTLHASWAQASIGQIWLCFA